MPEEKFEISEDGLLREIVGEWATDKHERLRKYIDIARHVRRKFRAGPSASAAYIELFSGTGQSRIRDTQRVIDGSPVTAYRKAAEGGQPFTGIHLGDQDARFPPAACERIRRLGGSATPYVGPASEVARQIVLAVHPNGYHFALLDPYKLESLSFDIIQTLGRLRHVDMLLHVSAMDLTRNLDRYAAEDEAAFDLFAPGCRDAIDLRAQGQQSARAAVLQYWSGLVQKLGFNAPFYEVVRAPGNQRLYWLAFISREEKAHEFWDKIRHIDGQGDLLTGLV